MLLFDRSYTTYYWSGLVKLSIALSRSVLELVDVEQYRYPPIYVGPYKLQINVLPSFLQNTADLSANLHARDCIIHSIGLFRHAVSVRPSVRSSRSYICRNE